LGRQEKKKKKGPEYSGEKRKPAKFMGSRMFFFLKTKMRQEMTVNMFMVTKGAITL